MTSPPMSPAQNLQGASRTSGGIIRGRAFGNVFNFADTSDLQMDLDITLAIPGKVYLYESVSDSVTLDPTKVKPKRIIKTDVSRTLEPVLTKLSRKYSPVRSESIFYCIFVFHLNYYNRIKYAHSHIRRK
jgi:hypothetical protein